MDVLFFVQHHHNPPLLSEGSSQYRLQPDTRASNKRLQKSCWLRLNWVDRNFNACDIGIANEPLAAFIPRAASATTDSMKRSANVSRMGVRVRQEVPDDVDAAIYKPTYRRQPTLGTRYFVALNKAKTCLN